MRVVETVVADLDVDDATRDHALSTAREKALSATTDRLVNLAAACEEVERWAGVLLWPAAGGGARRTNTVVELEREREVLAWCPRYPQTQRMTARALVSVRQWNIATSSYEDADHDELPGGRVLVRQFGTFEVVADLTTGDVPALAREAAARLWTYRELKRPTGDPNNLVGGEQSLAGAMYRSGASGILRSLKVNGRA